jgi:hypothetical protein
MPVRSVHTTVSVAIPSGVATQLFPLILALDPNASPTVRDLIIQNDPASASSVRIGGPSVSATQGSIFTAGGSESLYGKHNQGIKVRDFWAYGLTGTATLNLQLLRG